VYSKLFTSIYCTLAGNNVRQCAYKRNASMVDKNQKDRILIQQHNSQLTKAYRRSINARFLSDKYDFYRINVLRYVIPRPS